MIKLERGEKPKELTDELVEKLTEEFKQDKNKRVWDKPFIRNALLNISHQKCCYCETKLIEEGKYLTVDHYHYKSKYPDEVVAWENLLPSCNRCNISKGTHDAKQVPIINPTVDNPKDFLYMQHDMYRSINHNAIGKISIETLSLNDSDEMVEPRRRIRITIEEKLEKIYEWINRFDTNNSSVADKNKIYNNLKGLLRTACPDREYSALVSTTIFEDDNYLAIKNKMKEYSLWDDKLEMLEITVKNICLSKYIKQ